MTFQDYMPLDEWLMKILRTIDQVGFDFRKKVVRRKITYMALNVMSLNLKVFRCKKKHYEVSKKVWYAKFLGISYNRVELITLPLILTGVVKVSTSKGDYLASAGTTAVYNEVIDTVSRLKESLLSHGYAGYGKKFFFCNRYWHSGMV